MTSSSGATPPVHNREQAKEIVETELMLSKSFNEAAERVVDALLPQPDPEAATPYDPRMDDVRWTITGLDAFKARAYVWDGPVLARGERVLVAPAAALERAEERLRAVEEAARVVLAWFWRAGRTNAHTEEWEAACEVESALRAVLSSQEPSADHTEEER